MPDTSGSKCKRKPACCTLLYIWQFCANFTQKFGGDNKWLPNANPTDAVRAKGRGRESTTGGDALLRPITPPLPTPSGLSATAAGVGDQLHPPASAPAPAPESPALESYTCNCTSNSARAPLETGRPPPSHCCCAPRWAAEMS